MRHSVIVAAGALVTAIVAIWGATAITAHAPRAATAVPASAPFNVMQMMSDARNLPAQQFDAY